MKTIILLRFFTFLLVVPNILSAQLVSVSGIITNIATGDTIKYASVYEMNSEIGTISDVHGNYALRFSSGFRQIKIEEPGFEIFKSSFDLKSDTIIHVSLIPNKWNKREKHEIEIQADARENSNHSTSKRRFLFF